MNCGLFYASDLSLGRLSVHGHLWVYHVSFRNQRCRKYSVIGVAVLHQTRPPCHDLANGSGYAERVWMVCCLWPRALEIPVLGYLLSINPDLHFVNSYFSIHAADPARCIVAALTFSVTSL